MTPFLQRRISLHNYDPKDLSSVLHMEQSITDADKSSHVIGHNTVKDEQLSLNSMQSLQLRDVSTDRSKFASRTKDFGAEKCDTRENHEELEEWEASQEQAIDFDDSDDDLL
jgi:hypothetical protein